MKSKLPYNKPFLSIDEQLKQLKSRGMKFENYDIAKHYFRHLNYYRLSAYWLPYEQDHTTHTFKKNTYFEEVLRDYTFDRELRLLILYAIEHIEVSIKTQMAYVLSKNYGSHAILKPELFACPVNYASNLNKLKNEYDRNDETFSRHFKDKYIEKLPPIWVCVELMTMGHISYWFANIKRRADRNAIAKVYDIDEKILKSFLHQLTIIRNICAHHSRLWNRRFTFSIKLPNNPKELSNSLNRDNSKIKNIYNMIVVIKYLMDKINPTHQWDKRLKNLIHNKQVNTLAMGFPIHWEELPVWK